MPNPMTKRNTILKGYAAFTNGDWGTLGGLLSPGVIWHPMHDPDHTITGRDDLYEVGPDGNARGVLEYLKKVRETTDVELFGVAVQGDVAVTLDFAYVTPGGITPAEGDHGCADKIVFDENGLIKEVWHCDADTHEHSEAGHPAT